MNPSKVDRSRLAVLTDLPNVGPASAADFCLLGLYEPSQIKGCCPFELYERLCISTARRHDPCVIDLFMSVTRFLDGDTPQPWWAYTEERKKLLKQRNAR